jgi:hypothetical protein
MTRALLARRILGASIAMWVAAASIPSCSGPEPTPTPDLTPFERARAGTPDARTEAIAERMAAELTSDELEYLVTMRWETLDDDPDAILRDPTWRKVLVIARSVEAPRSAIAGDIDRARADVRRLGPSGGARARHGGRRRVDLLGLWSRRAAVRGRGGHGDRRRPR